MNNVQIDSSPRRNVRLIVIPAVAALLTGIVITVALAARSTGDTPDPADGQFHRLDGNKFSTERPKLREARAPLSTDEIGYAVHLAATADGMPQTATDIAGNKGAQLLYADLPPLGGVKSDDRLAAVSLYDYKSDLAYQVRVNLSTGTAEKAKTDPVLQPPPVADEAAAAMQLALDPGLGLQFQTQFEQSNGLPLLSPDQVNYQAGIWTYDETTRAGKACGKHRCVQLLVRNPSGEYLDTGDFVVDLSTRTVVNLHGGKS